MKESKINIQSYNFEDLGVLEEVGGLLNLADD